MKRSELKGVFLPNRPKVQGGMVDLLLDVAEREPDRPHFRWPDGRMMTVGELADRSRRWATVLAAEGVERGDRVALVGGNSEDYVATQFGTYMLGAVEVPVNAELRGSLLARGLSDPDPKVIIIDEDLYESVSPHVPEGVKVLVRDGDTDARVAAAEPIADPVHPAISDLAFILYTSGTTGPSKGVMLPHGYLLNTAATWTAAMGTKKGDGMYFPAPFFHVDAHVVNTMCLMTGATLGIAKRFSVSRFWEESYAVGATLFLAVGSMASALVARKPEQPPEHAFRLGIVAPIMPEVYDYFEDELGIPLLQLYGQTEADGVVFCTLDKRKRGSAGWACCGFDVRIVDEHDEPVPVGEVGRLLYRPHEAHMMTMGYWRRPDATAESTRNLWWHTGDLARVDEDGFLFFEGRASDSIRRRGENISAWELEAALRDIDGVQAAAAIPVRDEIGGEDEVKVFIVLEEGFEWDAERFFAACQEQLPRFAQPRFVELVTEDDLVRGPGTGAIQKHLLPRENTDKTIDRMEVFG